LPAEAVEVEPRGHAIEARLYAEDPATGFLPQAGTLHRFRVGGGSGSGVRVDTGVGDGSVVGVHYDPLLAKVVAHAPTRPEAARLLASALAGAHLHGLVTNRDLLVGILRSEAFLAGDTTTGFLDHHPPAELTTGGGSGDPSALRLHAAAAALAAQAARRAAAPVYPAVPSGWRNNPSQLQRVDLEPAPAPRPGPGATVSVGYRFDRAGTLESLEVDGDPLPGPRLWRCSPDERAARTWLVDLEVGGVLRRFEVHRVGDTAYVDSPLGHTALRDRPAAYPEASSPSSGDPGSPPVPSPSGDPGVSPPVGSVAGGQGAVASVAHSPGGNGVLVSPLPGVVRRVAVGVGDRVEIGAVLVVVEAMKTEHRVAAARAGTVRRVLVAEGQEVAAGTMVVELEEAADG
ncbi:MAG TPA: biotin/lipoyl-containing protein, partial [Actinomycetes bacterium]|nr:biotin/lipoyl-containing protein [Actinomycetes bacterium]